MTAKKHDSDRAFRLNMRIIGLRAQIVTAGELSTFDSLRGRDSGAAIKKCDEEIERIKKDSDYDPNYGYP